MNALSLNAQIKHIVNKHIWTNSLGLARTLFAISTLCNLFFNTDTTLGLVISNSYEYSDLQFYSIFQLFDNLYVSRFICYAILALVTLGVYPKYICILHWWVSFSYLISSSMLEGGDQITSIMTFLLIPVLIFDKRHNHWSKKEYKVGFYPSTIAIFTLFCIKIQVFIIYFSASTSKFAVKEWMDGTAIYYWFTDPVFGLNNKVLENFKFILMNPIAVTVLTWGALAVELYLASILFWGSKRTKMISLILGMVLHLSFALVFGLWSFFLAMSGALVLYLIADQNLTLSSFVSFKRYHSYEAVSYKV